MIIRVFDHFNIIKQIIYQKNILKKLFGQLIRELKHKLIPPFYYNYRVRLLYTNK